MFHTHYSYHTTSAFSSASSEQKYVTSNFSYYVVKAFNKPTTENDQTCACNAYLVHSSSCYWPAKWMQPDIHRAMKLLHLVAIWYMGWTKGLEFVHFNLYTNTQTHHTHTHYTHTHTPNTRHTTHTPHHTHTTHTHTPHITSHNTHLIHRHTHSSSYR